MNIKDRIDEELSGIAVDRQLAGRIVQKARSAKRAKSHRPGFVVAGAAFTVCAALALLVLPALFRQQGATLMPLSEGEDSPVIMVEVTPEPTAEPTPEPEETPVPTEEPVSDDVNLAYDRIPESPELPTAHRPGFIPAQITFKGMKADAKYVDVNGNKLSATNYDVAQYGLRELYDITGYLVEKCYVESHDSSIEGADGAWMNYSFDGEYWFLRYAVDSNLSGNSSNYNMICIGYTDGTMLSGSGGTGAETSAQALRAGKTSLIPMDNIACPQNIGSMSAPEIAAWYYENSTFGDRRRIVRTELDGSQACWGGGSLYFTRIKLFLSNGMHYDVWLETDTNLIVAIFGPYH